MKHLSIFLCLLFFGPLAIAQSGTFERLPVSIILVGDVEKKPETVKSTLANKLMSIANTNGMLGSNVRENRFVIAANVVEETKDISSTTPVMYGYSLAVNIKIGDGISGTIYNSLTLPVKGLDRSEEKAYLAAIRSINVDKREIKDFIENSKTKIIEFYIATCDASIAKARQLANQKNYDESLYELSVIPNISSVCFEKVAKASDIIFKEKVEFECASMINAAELDLKNAMFEAAFDKLKLIPVDASCFSRANELADKAAGMMCKNSMTQARAAWSRHDFEAAVIALSEVKSGSTCDADALALIQEIKAYKQAQETREWKFELKKQDDTTKLAAQRIKAARDVGVAYGKNRPKIIYKVGWF